MTVRVIVYAVVFCLLSLPVLADGPRRYVGKSKSYGNTVRLNLYPYDSGIEFVDPFEEEEEEDHRNPCFPWHCGDKISEPITNPSPRKPEQIPACYYDINDVLFFEKEGSDCPYKRPPSPNAARIEKRRQEWLKRVNP